MQNLTHQPFAALRATPGGTVLGEAALEHQRAAIAAIHTAAITRKTLERALYGLTYDVEGRAHDVNTGRYTSKPATKPAPVYLSAIVDDSPCDGSHGRFCPECASITRWSNR